MATTAHTGVDGAATGDVADAEREQALRLLGRLCLYVPYGRGGGVFGDGPASLARVQPYRRREVAAALEHGAAELPRLSLRQLAGLASALAAAQHADAPFMAALAAEAAKKLRAQAAAGGGEWGPVCHLAIAYARQGFVDDALMQALAAGEQPGPGHGHRAWCSARVLPPGARACREPAARATGNAAMCKHMPHELLATYPCTICAIPAPPRSRAAA